MPAFMDLPGTASAESTQALVPTCILASKLCPSQAGTAIELLCSNYSFGCCMQRTALSDDDIRAEVSALEQQGHRRLLVLTGEHPKYTFDQFLHVRHGSLICDLICIKEAQLINLRSFTAHQLLQRNCYASISCMQLHLKWQLLSVLHATGAAHPVAHHA